MSIQISIDLPESIFSSLRKTPETFVDEMRLAAAVKWFEAGMISQDKGAEIAGVSRCEFIDALSRFKVSPFQETQEDIAKEFSRALCRH
jgi:predicted HTH domain antitoxin